MKKKKEEYQIKFVVDEEQKQRLEKLAALREISVPQFAKLSALGVRLTPSPVIKVVEQDDVAKKLLDKILKSFEVKEDGSKSLFISSKFDNDLVKEIEDYMKKM